jgi:hypothetical protein
MVLMLRSIPGMLLDLVSALLSRRLIFGSIRYAARVVPGP